MEIVSRYSSYKEYKQVLDNELQQTAEGFVRIGYLLKQARDTDVLNGSGYTNYIEFAQQEYGIDKTMVSRFIRINDKFAEDGNSEQLKDQYKGFGYAKLAIMLQLPDEVNNILTPDFSKTEINAIKEEIDEENKISDLEVMMEPEENMTKYGDSTLNKALMQYLHDDPETYIQLYETFKECMGSRENIEKIVDILAPSGTRVIMVRIQGMGRLAVSLKGMKENIEIVNLRNGETEIFSWLQMVMEVSHMMIYHQDAVRSWEKLFLESFPEKEEPEKPKVAPVQPQKADQKKQSKVTKAKTKKNVVQEKLHSINQDIPEPDPVMPIEKKMTEEMEENNLDKQEQIPGQDRIENHPEYLPEEKPVIMDVEYKEVIEETPEDGVNTENEQDLTGSIFQMIREIEEELPGSDIDTYQRGKKIDRCIKAATKILINLHKMKGEK